MNFMEKDHDSGHNPDWLLIGVVSKLVTFRTEEKEPSDTD